MSDEDLDAGVSSSIKEQLQLVDEDRKALLNRALRMTQAHGGDLYPFDLFANGALNRAVALSTGFCTMIEAKNLICAGAIVRLHLDTAARFSAGFMVLKPHDFAIDVLKGKKISDMVDQQGKKLTDRYLISQLAAEYPWVTDLYDQTCDYIHFSGTHLHSAFDGADVGQLSVKIKISSVDRDLPEGVYSSAILAFRQVTAVLARYIDGWIFTKDNPETVARWKMERDSVK